MFPGGFLQGSSEISTIGSKMFKYVFKGKIHPERVNFTINQEIPLNVKHSDFGISGDVLLKIEKSKIYLTFKSQIAYSSTNNTELETLKNILEESVRLVVDIFCYIKSYSYDVEIELVECRDLNLDYIFGVRGEWNVNKDDTVVSNEYSRILNLFTEPKNTTFGHVLADFRRAIKYPAMTASFCYRSIETIRKHTFEDWNERNEEKRRKDGWLRLRNEFNLSQKDFEEIEKFALPNRHGEYPKITYEERERIMNFTRSIIDETISRIYS